MFREWGSVREDGIGRAAEASEIDLLVPASSNGMVISIAPAVKRDGYCLVFTAQVLSRLHQDPTATPPGFPERSGCMTPMSSRATSILFPVIPALSCFRDLDVQAENICASFRLERELCRCLQLNWALGTVELLRQKTIVSLHRASMKKHRG